jgi:serine/threonine protein phosphatase PrpC
MNFHIFSAMTMGIRSIQEDCIFDGIDQIQEDEFVSDRTIAAETMLLAVCDGMGGHDKGDEASRFVCGQLKDISHESVADAEKLKKILAGIQDAALEKLPENCGTTVAGLFVADHRVIAFNAGDSRVYKVTPEGLTYISHDHSLVQEMVDRSLISTSAAKDHPLKNLIEFGLGPIFNDAWAQQNVHVHEAPLEEGDIFLLCSDGLLEAVQEVLIHDCLIQSPGEMGARLFALMKRKRLNDNASFILTEIHG